MNGWPPARVPRAVNRICRTRKSAIYTGIYICKRKVAYAFFRADECRTLSSGFSFTLNLLFIPVCHCLPEMRAGLHRMDTGDTFVLNCLLQPLYYIGGLEYQGRLCQDLLYQCLFNCLLLHLVNRGKEWWKILYPFCTLNFNFQYRFSPFRYFNPSTSIIL